MTMIAAIAGEFRRYRGLAEGALAQVGDDAALHRALGADDNSIAVIMQHVGGNLRSRFTDFLTSDGEKPWRDRDGEFVDAGATRADLLARWNAGWDALHAALAALGPDDLARTVTIRGQPLTVEEALQRAVAHTAYHVGQIVLLARWIVGERWTSLSVARGGSAAYARNPTKERA
jgi:hypothetical protein